MGNINLRCSSKGIGDMVCGLYVAQSLKGRFPKYNITYYVLQPQWFKYVTEINIKHYLEIENELPTDIFIETSTKYYRKLKDKTRKEIYCSKVPLLNLSPIKPITKQLKVYNNGDILLFPYAHWFNRDWCIDGWLSLEKRLKHKYGDNRIKVIGTPNQDLSLFDNPINNLDRSEVLDLIIKSSLIIGNDSGMVHVAGLYDIPAISIINSFTGEHLFSQTNIKTLSDFTKVNSKNVFDLSIDILNTKRIFKHRNILESSVEFI